MKKLISILLVMMMILCMGTTAFADETPTTNISIDKVEGDTTRSYNAYELLKLTTSLKCDHGEGTTHVASCYNYAYTVNEDYREILQEEVYVNAKDAFWNTDNPKPTTKTDVTDAQILDYLSKLAGDNEADDTYGTLRAAADRIYRVIKDTTPDAELQSGANTGVIVEQGYWLIADVTGLNGKEEANSLVMVNTKGQDTLTLTPKTALPQFEKKVQDINDSTDNEISDNAWADSADHDKGDAVPFKLTATVPANVSSYGTYKMVFHDTMGAGLTLDPDSVEVYVYDTKNDADKNQNGTLVFRATEYKDKGYESADVKLTPKNDHEFELTLSNVLTGADAADGNNAFVVYYKAELNEEAEMGKDGNSNTAYLEFSNDPYSNGTGKTQEDTVKVFTYQLTINKVDEANDPLPGAGFTLYKKINGEFTKIGDELTGGTEFTWDRLDDGDYKLVESTVPAGYNKMDDLEFTISAEHDPELTSLSGGALGTGDIDTGIIEEPVTNYTGTVLPSTGAKGTMMLIGGGSVFIVLAAVFMITRKKMSIYED